jgi:hypothetical protein
VKKLLSAVLAASALSLTTIAISPSVAEAATFCTFSGTPFGTQPLTVGVAGHDVHVPSVKVRLCYDYYGTGVFADIPQYVIPRVVPGTCSSTTLDPACFTVYVDALGWFGITKVTVETFIDDVPQTPIPLDLPQLPPGAQSVCVLSVGYRSAPTHDCLAFLDLGQ